MVSTPEIEVILLLAATVTTLTEELIEHILMACMTMGMLALCMSLNSLFSVFIIHAALLGIAQYLIGVC